VTDSSKNIIFLLLFSIIFFLHLLINYPSHIEGNQYCQYGISNAINFDLKQNSNFCESNEYIQITENTEKRIIDNENGKGIVIFGINIGNLGVSYFFNDIGTAFYLFFEKGEFSKDRLISTILVINNLVTLSIIFFVLLKISNYRISLFLVIVTLLTYILWYVLKRYYGLSLIDDLTYNIQNRNSLFESILISIKSFFSPSFSISGFGIHPRNNSILLVCIAFLGILLNKSKISIHLIFLSILFHFWVGISALIVVLLFLFFLKRKTLSLFELILLFFLILLSVEQISSNLRFIIGVLILIFILINLNYNLNQADEKNSIDLKFIMFFNVFLITIFIFSINSVNFIQDTFLNSIYIVNGFRAEAFQRLNVVNLFLILFLTYNLIYNYISRNLKNRYKI
jgi:hypothetical protein